MRLGGPAYLDFRVAVKQAKSLPFTGRVGRDGASRSMTDMSNDDWKKTLPFKRHWAVYLLFKLVVLALAVAFALRVMGYV